MFILGPSTREVDYSLYVANVSNISFGVVGTATKGEIGVPTFVSNQNDFAKKFGDQDPNCLATYAAMEFLSEGNQLWFTRVASELAKASSATVKSVGDTPEDLIKFEGKTPGTSFDGIKVDITNVSEVAPFTFDITVIDKTGRAIEIFKGVSTDATSPNFVDVVVNGKSKELVAEYLLAESVKPAVGTVILTGGNNGIDGIDSTDYIGSPTKKTGLQSMKHESVEITLLAVPGVSDPEVIMSGYGVAEERGDVLFLVDPPLGLEPQEVVDWHNGAGTFSDHQAFNSSYAALYWSWQEIYDSPNGVNVFIPPSGLVAKSIAYSSRVAEVWYAPAGLKRGRLNKVLRSEYNPDKGEQALLYGTQGNNINPIIKHPEAGIAIFGQKTLQRMPSATDRVNVRLLLNYLRKIIAGTAAYLTFDPNDRTTWNEFEDLIEPTLRNIKNKRGLYDYKVQMDATNVTPDFIDNYQMPGRIYIQPTKAAESIPIDFIVTRTGAEFLNYENIL